MTQCGQPESRVAGSGARRLVDEDPDQHSTHSSVRARAERCKELKEEKESNVTEHGTRDS